MNFVCLMLLVKLESNKAWINIIWLGLRLNARIYGYTGVVVFEITNMFDCLSEIWKKKSWNISYKNSSFVISCQLVLVWISKYL